MKIALLIDGSSIAQWQADALDQLGPEIQLEVWNCANMKAQPRRLTHFAYYALNVVSLRTELTRRIPLPERLGRPNDFECRHDGHWQHLPDDVIDRLRSAGPHAIVKFGMGLLKVPEPATLPVPILSYHHGDPSAFRGRPAGFYEMLNGAGVLGQIVQVLSNRLDAGRVVAFAETRIHRHSYRATMREAYATSRFLLGQALTAVREGRTIDIVPEGPVYRLPSPWTVVRFGARQALAKARRLAYGAFVEKRWRVAEASRTPADIPPFCRMPDSSKWREVRRPKGYRFLADPFPLPDGSGMLVEALRSSTGLGEILVLGGAENQKLLGGQRHFSYPSVFSSADGHWLLPEVAEWSAPRLYSIAGGDVEEAGKLKIADHYRLVDPTLLEWRGHTFLFANHLPEGDSILRLWMAASVHDEFQEHRSSPIRISPLGGRMAGSFIISNGSLYRVGQNGAGSYGDGVLFFEVEELSAEAYRERLAGSLRFDHCRGPHTLNITADSFLFDFYRDRIAPLAGVRRLRGRIARN